MRAILIACLLLISGNAFASSPFDGKWVGASEPTGACDIRFTIEMVVANGAISGAVIPERRTPEGYTRGNIQPGASVAPDGLANIVIGERARYPAALRFTRDTFAGNMNATCGPRTISGSRVK